MTNPPSCWLWIVSFQQLIVDCWGIMIIDIEQSTMRFHQWLVDRAGLFNHHQKMSCNCLSLIVVLMKHCRLAEDNLSTKTNTLSMRKTNSLCVKREGLKGRVTYLVGSWHTETICPLQYQNWSLMIHQETTCYLQGTKPYSPWSNSTQMKLGNSRRVLPRNWLSQVRPGRGGSLCWSKSLMLACKLHMKSIN